MTAPDHARKQLHEGIQGAIQAPGMVPDEVAGGVLVKWVVVAEVAMTADRMSLVHISGNAIGADVRSWDQSGMLGKVLVRELFKQGG